MCNAIFDKRKCATHHHHIESAVEYAHNLGVSDDRPILLRKVIDEVAKMKVVGLFLSNLRSISLGVAVLCTFRNLIPIHHELGFGSLCVYIELLDGDRESYWTWLSALPLLMDASSMRCTKMSAYENEVSYGTTSAERFDNLTYRRIGL